MSQFDLPLDQLRLFDPELNEPNDFDLFWSSTLAESAAEPIEAQFIQVENGLSLVASFDVTFRGAGGNEVKAWLQLPASLETPVPVVVEYAGYSGGRGLAHQRLLWAAAGYAYFIMDSRGQGWGGAVSDTADSVTNPLLPSAPGLLTRGILDPHQYYYRRLVVDAVRAVEAAQSHSMVRADCTFVSGHSQGGGVALAVAGLRADLLGALIDVPFLLNFRRGVEVATSGPYLEIAQYLRRNRGHVAEAFRTLAYFDGASHATRARTSALFSVALLDSVCPPSTVFTGYNRYAGSKQISVYEFNDHEGGQEFHEREQLRWVKSIIDSWAKSRARDNRDRFAR
jgi:cephalosporin-C deacetylase